MSATEGSKSLDPMYQFRVLSIRHMFKNHRFSLKFEKGGSTNETEIVDLNDSIIEFSVPFDDEEQSVSFEIMSDSPPIEESTEEKVKSTDEPLSYKVEIDLKPFDTRGFKYRISHPLFTSESSKQGSVEMRILIKGDAGITPEEKYPFYRMFSQNYQFLPLVREILSFLSPIELLSRIHMVSGYLRRVIREKFEFDLSLSGNFSLPALFRGLKEFKVKTLAIKSFNHEDLDFGDFGTPIADENTEEEEEPEKPPLFFETLKELSLQDKNLIFPLEFVEKILDWFSNLDFLELEGEYDGHIRLQPIEPRFAQIREQMPHLAFHLEAQIPEIEEEPEEMDEKDDPDTEHVSGEPGWVSTIFDPDPKKKRGKNLPVHQPHEKLRSFTINPKISVKQPEKDRNINFLMTTIMKRCPNLDFLGCPLLTGIKITMVPKTELIEMLMAKREKTKGEWSRDVNIPFFLDNWRSDSGFGAKDKDTHRRIFFLNGYFWMFGVMLKNSKITDEDFDLMSAGLLSFDSVFAVKASNEIKIDNTVRGDSSRWFSPQSQEMYSVHLNDRKGRGKIYIQMKIKVDEMMKSNEYREVCFAAAKRAEDKRIEIAGRKDSAIIEIKRNESHKEGKVVMFGLEWSYKFYRTKGKINRASFFIIRHFGGRIVIPMSYTLHLLGTDFTILASEYLYHLQKGWGYTDLLLPIKDDDEVDTFKLDMRIGEHVMTIEQYTERFKDMLRTIKEGDIETKNVTIVVDHFYASIQYPDPVKIAGFPFLLEMYPNGYFGNTKSIALGICSYMDQCYYLKANFTVEVKGRMEEGGEEVWVKQEVVNDGVEVVLSELCMIDKSKKEWEFKITIEVVEFREKRMELPF